MGSESAPAGDGPERAWADDAAAIDLLAALDDRLAGHAAVEGDSGRIDRDEPTTPAGDSPALAAAVDLILLLRQAAAEECDRLEEPLVLPQRIGRYEIRREAGRGAFAYVLEARDEILHRRVALKIARPEALVSVALRRRFIREAELAARLIHPHVVVIHEVGEESGLVFISSEYCAGGDLAAWLDRHPGPLPPRQAAEIVRELATAVSYAHSKGIVHRDIKPANVLLVPRPPGAGAAPDAAPPLADMTVKLGDFGLGKLFVEQPDHQLTDLTRTGSRLGTPAWMAPEQIDRSFGEAGPATDVHALGLLLDRLLTGRVLFAGKTEAETFRAILLEEAVGADRANPRVPAELAAVGLACLAKRPADRYPSAAALADDLSRFLAGEPTLARPLSMAARISRSIARRPWLAILAVAACGALALAAWTARARSRATLQLAARQESLDRLEAAAELRRGFEAWRNGNVVGIGDHLTACAAKDGALAASVAARWLESRLHGEHDLLLEPEKPGLPRADIYCFTFARDGRTLAAGGADGRLFLVPLGDDGSAAGPPTVVQAHDEINDVAFSPDGRRVATAGEDGRLLLWNVADASPVGELFRAEEPLFAAAFSPAGDAIACGGGKLGLWIVPVEPAAADTPPPGPPSFTEALVSAGMLPDADVEAMHFLGDGRIVLSGGKIVAILDPAAGTVRLIRGHERTVGQISLSADGRRLISGGIDREPRVWDLDTGALLLTLPRHPGWVQGCDFSPDGTTIATGCRDGVVRIFDAATGAMTKTLSGHLGRTWDVKFDRAGMAVSSGADGTLRRWDATADADTLGMRDVRLGSVFTVPVTLEQSFSIAIREEGPGARSLVVPLDGRLLVVDAASGRKTEIRMPLMKRGPATAFDAAGGRLAIAAVTDEVRVYPLPRSAGGAADPVAASAAFRPLPVDEACVAKDVAWTPTGQLVAGFDNCLPLERGRGRVFLWDAALERAALLDRAEMDLVRAVRIDPAGAGRVAIAANKVVRVCPLPVPGRPAASGGLTIVTLGPEDGIVLEVAWSPDGTQLAYGTSEGRVATVDAGAGRETRRFPKLAHAVAGLAWAGDGRTLVAADAHAVRFSDAASAITYDEVRPGWTIVSLAYASPTAACPWPLLAVVGCVAETSGAAEGRLGIFDLRHAPSLGGAKP